MRQCPVCESETGDEPVCPVCGFDISCDYERFPTLGTGIPRDLKARALQRVKDAKDDTGEAEGPTGAPEQAADEPPVSLLSEKEAAARIETRTAFASLFALVTSNLSCFLYVGLVHALISPSSLLSPEDGFDGFFDLFLFIFIPFFLFIFIPFIIMIRWSLKKMKPDEWIWKKQSDGKWIVLEKDIPDSGREKKMLTALLLLCIGGMFGFDIMYLDGFAKGKWRIITRCLISWLAYDSLWYMIINANNSPEDMPIWAVITMFVSFFVWFIFGWLMPLARIVELPPVFEKGEY